MKRPRINPTNRKGERRGRRRRRSAVRRRRQSHTAHIFTRIVVTIVPSVRHLSAAETHPRRGERAPPAVGRRLNNRDGREGTTCQLSRQCSDISRTPTYARTYVRRFHPEARFALLPLPPHLLPLQRTNVRRGTINARATNTIFRIVSTPIDKIAQMKLHSSPRV